MESEVVKENTLMIDVIVKKYALWNPWHGCYKLSEDFIKPQFQHSCLCHQILSAFDFIDHQYGIGGMDTEEDLKNLRFPVSGFALTRE